MEKIENTNKKFRNPFPAVGKVFKYEIISGARTILPLYAVLLVLSLVIGTFALNNNVSFGEASTGLQIVKGVIVTLFSVLSIVTFVIVLCVIERRYKKSMLGDEAYLSLTLPVTVGEHLWGRYLADLVWAIAYGITMLLSSLFILVRQWGRFFMEIKENLQEIGDVMSRFEQTYGFDFMYMFWMVCLNVLVFFMLICVFSYMTESIIQLIGKHKNLFSILIFAVVFFLFTNGIEVIIKLLFGDNPQLSAGAFWIPVCYNLVWSVLLSVITRLILMYKLNLE